MEKFSDYKKYFEIDIPEIIVEILNEKEVKQDIIDYNQKEQLSEGIDSLGQRIETISSNEFPTGYPYGRQSVEERGKAGLQVENVDLNFSGAFWSTFDVKVTKEETEVLADWTMYGQDIRWNFDSRYDFLGLTDNSLENFVWLSVYGKLEKRLLDWFAN